MVNNAGIIAHHDFFEECDLMMAVNTRGACLLAIEAAKAMADGGAIVCAASGDVIEVEIEGIGDHPEPCHK